MGLIPSMRLWRLVNEVSGGEVEGDFEATDLTEDVSATYADSFALNSDSPITQFLHGNVDALSFTARMFDDSIAPEAIVSNMKFVRVQEKMELLKQWVRREEKTGHPPVLLFSAGDDAISMSCTMPSLAGIRYDPLTWTGNVRGCTFTINLRRFIPFDVEAAATAPPETRYHRVQTGDYYELIAQREYGKPLLGDIIRHRHPAQHRLVEADTVKLPSFEAIQRERTVPRSAQLKGLSTSTPSAQHTLRQEFLDRLNCSYLSHLIPEGW